jgi:hypothetical protein
MQKSRGEQMKKLILLTSVVIIGFLISNPSFAQTIITSIPDTIRTPGSYALPTDTTFQIDTTGFGSVRAGIWITTEPDSETATLGVDDVFIDGQGAHLIGVAPSNTTEFGVWFKNRMSTLDTTYGDTLVNLNVKKFRNGIVFRWIADGLIENCTIDSVFNPLVSM